MSKELKSLLDKLCIEWGFCIPPLEAELIANLPHVDADDFARRILVAEGMNPEYEIQWRRKIRNKFIQTFGGEFNAE